MKPAIDLNKFDVYLHTVYDDLESKEIFKSFSTPVKITKIESIPGQWEYLVYFVDPKFRGVNSYYVVEENLNIVSRMIKLK